MADHALLGSSSAHRWMVCTPSARLEGSKNDKGSVYAQEGTLAHRLAELMLRAAWEGATSDFGEVEGDPLYSNAMKEHISDYVNYVAERMAEAKAHCPDPRVFIEQRLDLSEYIPESFGTSDCVILADGTMEVIDLKYGAGIKVDAEDNPQMKIYALGAFLALGWAYQIDHIRMTIFQPRKDNISCATITTAELLEWAETKLKPKALQAWNGEGEFCPGAHQCKWCKIGPTCRARAEYHLELAKMEFADPPTLENDEIAEVLKRLPGFQSWMKQVSDYALDQALHRRVRYPGLKLVEGTSKRKYKDQDKIAEALQAEGFKSSEIYKPKELMGLTAMGKLVGAKKFEKLAGPYIEKPPGAPTLVPEEDKRPEYNSAIKDFEEE